MDEREKKVFDALSAQCAKREYCTADIRRKALERLEWDAAAAEAVVEALARTSPARSYSELSSTVTVTRCVAEEAGPRSGSTATHSGLFRTIHSRVAVSSTTCSEESCPNSMDSVPTWRAGNT